MMKNRSSKRLKRTGLARIKTATPVMAGLVFAFSSMQGQGTTASLSGTVLDSSGAVIPKAKIVLKNENSNDQRVSSSNGSGVFSFSAVPVGDYDLTVSFPGFQTLEQTRIHLDPGDQRTVRDLNLRAGISDTVEVTDAAQQIQTDNGEQSALISAQDIQHLSVEGRDVTELFKILPGFAVSNGSGSVDNTAYDPSQVTAAGALGAYRANGTPFSGIALISDGADITDPGNFGSAMQTVNYDQVAEVKVQTSSFGSDTARGPIVVNAVGKSGGNNYHGSLYTYARTYQLNSTDWLAKYLGQTKPPDRQVYPGFTIGGPILIPGTSFNRSKKLTFFAGAEEYAQRNIYAYGNASGATLTALVPTAAMRTGDFSPTQLMAYLGPDYQPNATMTGCAGGHGNICLVPQTGPHNEAILNGNIAPFLDKGGLAEINSFPLPNVTNTTGNYNYAVTNLIANNLWQARGRVDYAMSDKNKLFVVYSDQRGVQGVPQAEYYSPRGSMGGINTPGGGLLSVLRSEFASANLTSIFSASLTNELQLSAVYFKQNFTPKNFAATNTYPYDGLFANGSRVLPSLEDYGNDGLPLTRLPDGTFGGIFAIKAIRTGGDNLTKLLGPHTMRVGVFYQLDGNNQVSPFIQTNGTLTTGYYMGETFTDPLQGVIHNTGVIGSGNGGNYLANFLEGHIGNYTQSNIQPKPYLFFKNIDFYAQDHWRVMPGLSVDFGARFEHLTPWGDTHNVGIPIFDAATYNKPLSAALPGFRWHAIDPTVPTGGFATRALFIEPRAGFAWDPYKKGDTILRGGLGVYRSHDAYNDVNGAAGTVIGQRSATVTNLLMSSVSSQASKFTSAGGFTPYSNVSGVDGTDSEQPEVFTYNVAIDQKLPKQMLFEIAYVGNIARHLLNNGSTQNTNINDINALPVGSLYKAQPVGVKDISGNLVSGGGTVYQLFAPAGSTGNNTAVNNLDQQHIDAFKPYPLYTRLQISKHNLSSNYNSMQVVLNKQQGQGRFGIAYTFSKALGILGSQGNGYPADPFNLQNDYQEEAFDHRHILSASYSYTVGKVFNERLLAGLANGWEVSGITVVQSGAPLAATNSPSFGIGGSVVLTSTSPTTGLPVSQSIGVQNTTILGTPDVNLQPVLLCDPRAHGNKHQYFNGACFGAPAVGTNGPYRYGFIPGPTYFDTDVTLAKTFHIHDAQNVQLRAAAFNVLNRANTSFNTASDPNALQLNFTGNTFATTDPNVGLSQARSQNKNFGYATVKEGRRIMELSLKYEF